MNSHEVFIHIHQGCFAGTGAIVRLPQCQWSKPDGYGKISQCITTTKHSKAKTVCIFLGIYCTCPSTPLPQWYKSVNSVEALWGHPAPSVEPVDKLSHSPDVFPKYRIFFNNPVPPWFDSLTRHYGLDKILSCKIWQYVEITRCGGYRRIDLYRGIISIFCGYQRIDLYRGIISIFCGYQRIHLYRGIISIFCGYQRIHLYRGIISKFCTLLSTAIWLSCTVRHFTLAFRVTNAVRRESTGHRWIPFTN